jgi:hypothetical protein
VDNEILGIDHKQAKGKGLVLGQVSVTVFIFDSRFFLIMPIYILDDQNLISCIVPFKEITDFDKSILGNGNRNKRI